MHRRMTYQWLVDWLSAKPWRPGYLLWQVHYGYTVSEAVYLYGRSGDNPADVLATARLIRSLGMIRAACKIAEAEDERSKERRRCITE